MKKFLCLFFGGLFAFGLVSCIQMDELVCVGQMKLPTCSLDGVSTDVILSRIDSLYNMYHRDAIVYGIPALSSREIIDQTEKAMQQISETDSWDTYVVISYEGIEIQSLDDRSSILPQNDEGVNAGFFTFTSNLWNILPCDVTVSWAGYGASVSASNFDYILGRSNYLLIVESANNARISGDFSLSRDTMYFASYSYVGNTNNNDSFSIHYFASQDSIRPNEYIIRK